MNSTDNYNGYREFKFCAGTNCNQKGIHELEIKYIHRTGWFCECCKSVLLEQNLIEVEKKGEVNSR